jgi:hypothetical protein
MAETNGKVQAEGQVLKVETKHYVKLMKAGQRTVNLPIHDRNSAPAIDPIYDSYQLFTRVVVTIDYNGSREVLKSGPLDAGEVIQNSEVAQPA